jgi:hypothetical protein
MSMVINVGQQSISQTTITISNEYKWLFHKQEIIRKVNQQQQQQQQQQTQRYQN